MAEKRSPKVFENPILDMLTRVSAPIAFGLYAALISGLFSMNFFLLDVSVWNALGVYVSGVFFWSFFEYVAHRFLFHIPGDSPRIRRFQYVIHGVHHDEPNDKTRLIMPPVPYILISSLLFGLFYLLMGSYAFGFLPGMLTGHLMYVSIHYLIHTPNPPRFLRYQLTHHALHHYKYPGLCFGVSSPLWDLVFGTMPPKSKARRS